VDGVAHLLERLNTADRLLDVRVKVLDAKRNASDAYISIGSGELRRDVTRIKFNCVPNLG
jgi:hypothetical protein